MRLTRDEILLLASRQCGWVAAWQLADLGLDRTTAWRMTKTGLLVHSDGLYRVASMAPGSPDARIWRAVLRTKGVVSHQTAALRHGADVRVAGTDVLVVYPRTPQPFAGVVVHRTRRLPESHVVEDGSGLRMTNAARTFLDLCGSRTRLRDRQLVKILEAWLAAGSATIGWVEWFIREEAAGLRGRPRAATLLGLDLSSESAAERELERLLRRAGLPGFVRQHPVVAGGRSVARVDFAWPEARVALELDGYRFHSGPQVFVRDRQRGNDIELAGWMLLRTTPFEVREEPGRLIEAVSRAVSAGAGGGGGRRRSASRA